MKEKYEDLLDRAMNIVPKTVLESTRFQIPAAEVSVMGNRTLIKNFKTITTTFNRDPEHLMKYLLRELGVAGDIQGAQAIFQGKFSQAAIEDRICKYADEFVLCRECHKPDTKLERRERVYVLQCEACGARTTVRGV